jgi:23S rRNA (adenine2503-C2)-methyltransferase
MSNLPKLLRDRLAKGFTITRLKERHRVSSRSDGATKYLLRLPDRRSIESVYLPHRRGATLCISSQVGCAYRCKFCATGTMKLKRNLSPGEIVDQIRFLEEELWDDAGKAEDGKQTKPAEQIAPDAVTEKRNPTEAARPFSNVVFMGMGEPFANYDNVSAAIRIMIEEMGIGSRRITVSTCGVPDGIMKFAREPHEVGLAISLNSPFDTRRRSLMPIAGRTPLEELMNAARHYFDKKGRMLTFEYVLIADVNDRMRDAYALADLLHDLPAKINLIALNPFPGCDYSKPETEKVSRFKALLESRGKKVTLRKSLGSDILAGCGQLGARMRRKKGSRRRAGTRKPADERAPKPGRKHGSRRTQARGRK